MGGSRSWRIWWSLLLLLSSQLLPHSASALEKVRIQLRWQHQFQFAGYYAAVDQGYYRESGFEVELVEAANEREPLIEVTEGRAAYGIGTGDLVLARSQGKKVVALAAIFQHSALVLLALREQGVESVHDLAGKRIAIEHEAAELVAYLKSEGLDLASLEFVSHGQDVQDLLSGKVAASSAYKSDEPFLLASAKKEIRIFDPRSGGIDFYGDTLFTTESEIEARPDRVEAILQATLRGWTFALEHPDVVIESILQRSSRHSREHLAFEAEKTAQLISADIVELGYMNPGRWRHIAEIYASLDLLESPVKIEDLIYRGQPERELPTWVVPLLLLSLLSFVAIFAAWLRAKRLGRELSRASERWRAFIEASPLAVIIVGEKGEVLYQNPRAQALSQTQEDLQPISHILKKPEVMTQLERARRESIPVNDIEASIESQSKFGSSTERWFSLSAAACNLEENRAVLVSLIDISSRKATEDNLRREAETDALTGVHNRRITLEVLRRELERARAQQTPFAIVMLDIDHFKSINDGYGHAMGDLVLTRLVKVCHEEIRGNDRLGRLGGEEFLVILPEADEFAAQAVGERLRWRIESGLTVVGEQRLQVTASLGLAVLTSEDTEETLLARADAGLYLAKKTGRNRVCLIPPFDPLEKASPL